MFTNVCESTGNLFSRFREYNRSHDLSDCMVGNMNAISLYPSIRIDFTTEKCIETISENELVFHEVNIRGMSLLANPLCDREYLDHNDLTRLCPTSTERGRQPTHGSAANKNTAECWIQWKAPIHDPGDNVQTRKMIAHAVGESLKITLQNYIVKFNKKLCMQKASIDVSVDGDMIGLFMK